MRKIEQGNENEFEIVIRQCQNKGSVVHFTSSLHNLHEIDALTVLHELSHYTEFTRDLCKQCISKLNFFRVEV